MVKIYEFLSPVSRYLCPVCEMEYATYEDCFKCIDGHAVPKSSLYGFEDWDYKGNAPKTVTVELNDGRLANYGLMDTWKPEIEVKDDEQTF